ncbi:hypothetical protein CEXT_733321 [Caerostris extrusa]|uniref:Uncharacterized protein n=1 Tax=Caerostris extrusa TaxID=172846 RepID=A0AAV4S227_CAEEX|nr:hypothetical protein CEXT_733321 [Caerostris extrusa]
MNFNLNPLSVVNAMFFIVRPPGIHYHSLRLSRIRYGRQDYHSMKESNLNTLQLVNEWKSDRCYQILTIGDVRKRGEAVTLKILPVGKKKKKNSTRLEAAIARKTERRKQQNAVFRFPSTLSERVALYPSAMCEGVELDGGRTKKDLLIKTKALWSRWTNVTREFLTIEKIVDQVDESISSCFV